MVISIAIVVVLASLVLIFAQEMRMEAQAAAHRASALQASAVARGAVAHVINQLTSSQDMATLDSLIQADGAAVGTGFFWIVRPGIEDERIYEHGIQDEAGRLNINEATYDMLMKLPNMTSELASSILDWRDADETISENGGAENEHYLLLEDPYYCKNAPFESLEELLLVKGATREMLYGVDANRNGVVDVNEESTQLSSGGSTGLAGLNGNARCGLMKYLTCYSRSANTDSTGKARVNVNTANNDQLAQTLTKAGVTGPRLAEALGKVRENKPFKSTVDFYFKLELKIEEFKKISDTITTDARKIIPGLINVNTAPKEVLQCIPGLEAGDADALVAQRSSGGLNTATASAGIAWVLDALSQAKATEAAPFITTGSKRFSAQIVGVSGDGRAFKRARAVFDASGTTPKLLYYKDQSHLGWPLDSYILEQLRTGQYAGQTASGLSGQTGLNSGATGGVR